MTSVSDVIVNHNNWNSVFYDSSLIHPCLFSILISCSYSELTQEEEGGGEGEEDDENRFSPFPGSSL